MHLRRFEELRKPVEFHIFTLGSIGEAYLLSEEAVLAYGTWRRRVLRLRSN